MARTLLKKVRCGPHIASVYMDSDCKDFGNMKHTQDGYQITISSVVNKNGADFLDTYIHEALELVNAAYGLELKHSKLHTIACALSQVLTEDLSQLTADLQEQQCNLQSDKV